MEVIAIHYKEAHDRQMQTKLHINVENDGADRMTCGWKEEVKIDLKLDVRRNKFFKMMTEFECIQNGHLLSVRATKFRIKITSNDPRPVQSAP